MSVVDFEVVREGDAFQFLWRDLGFGLGFDQLQEDRWGLYAELYIRTTQLHASTGRPSHVYQSRFNLSQGPDRDKLAKALKERPGCDVVPWRDMLEIACTETLSRFRAGAPVRNLAETRITPQLHLIDRMIPVGETSVLYGDGASAKSMIALAIGLAVRTGATIGPFRPTRQAAVLTLDWETTEEEQAERLSRMCAGLGMRNLPEFHYRPMWRPLASDLTTTRQEIARLDVGLVIIDSIALAVGGDVTAENAIPFYNALRSFGSTVTRVVVSHVSKAVAAQETGVGDPYGSVFVTNFGRSVWALQRVVDGEGDAIEVGMFHRKVNRGRLEKPVGVRVAFCDPSGPITFKTIDVMDNVELSQHGSVGDRLYVALREGDRTTAELAEETGATVPTVLRTLTRRRDEFVRVGSVGGRGKQATWGLLTHEVPR